MIYRRKVIWTCLKPRKCSNRLIIFMINIKQNKNVLRTIRLIQTVFSERSMIRGTQSDTAPFKQLQLEHSNLKIYFEQKAQNRVNLSA